MTVRFARPDRKNAIRALGVAAALVLGGCATPHTQLEWNVRESALHRHAVHRVVRRESLRPVRHEEPVSDSAVCATPTPRPDRDAHKDNVDPAPVDPTPAKVEASAGDGRFAWPLKGQVISDYGTAPNGSRNEGINIAAEMGEPIHAAADGTVSYAGNDLKSYGNLMLIKHDDGYVTAYAHAEKMLVNRGDHVSRGQVIGYAGDTGDVNRPQLHFEIRRGVTPVNPVPLLSSLRMASR